MHEGVGSEWGTANKANLVRSDRLRQSSESNGVYGEIYNNNTLGIFADIVFDCEGLFLNRRASFESTMLTR